MATILCPADTIAENAGRGFELEGRRILVVRRGGTLYAYENACPHAGVALEWVPDEFFDEEGRYLQCSMHGATFRPEDGYCVSGPCQGDSLTPVVIEVVGGQVILPG